MSDRISKLVWLKRTDGHRFTGAEFRVLIALFNHASADGSNAHPGVELMVEETGYRKTAISDAVASLKERGWIHETYRGNGKTGKASAFDLVPDAPNPAYRCGARRCSSCSNTPAGAGLLATDRESNTPARAEVLESNTTATAVNTPAGASNTTALVSNTPAGAVTNRSLSDPGSDPGSDPFGGEPKAPPSDPREVRYSPDQFAVQVESPFSGETLLASIHRWTLRVLAILVVALEAVGGRG